MDWILDIELKDWCLIAVVAVLFVVTLVDVRDAHRHYVQRARRPQ